MAAINSQKCQKDSEVANLPGTSQNPVGILPYFQVLEQFLVCEIETNEGSEWYQVDFKLEWVIKD